MGNHKNDLSTITAPSTIFTQGFATSGFLTEMHQSAILVPALQSQWLMMHVSMMLLSYAALLCGSLLSVALLVITFRKNIDIFVKAFFVEQYGLMRHGDLIGIGTPKKLGLLLLGPYSRFIYILELEYILEVEQIKV
ncbi:hypothetical protein C4D60_Mb00t12660 [Musa balbisiana]|uniref:Cytochrome c assembly protein domain-containing protein n=1 Tax=Musa balbisiana TaxID=52838 RepID=A0A4S8I5A8_MUSBA|nr:hypothetical protein C4D60_Mb00t12660 [Musa balbisiana]